MKLAEKLYDAGRGSVTATLNKATMFQPLDMLFLRKKLQIKEKATENGKNNIPATESLELDSVESAIVAAIGDAKRQYVDDYDRQILAYSNRIREHRSILADFSIVNQFKDTIADLKTLINDHKATLYNREEAVKAITNETLRFRTDHALLHRTPAPHKALHTAVHISVAGLLEIALTTALIRDAGNLITVAAVATVFFVLNILVVFFIFSKFAKYVNSNRLGRPDLLRRSFGWCVSLIYLVYATTINLVFSHLRSVSAEVERLLAENPDSYLETFQNIGNIAWARFLQDGIYLSDVNSYALFILGFFLSLYIFVIGFTTGDSYPGYGQYIRRYDDAIEEYDEVMNETLERFTEARKEGMQQAESRVKDIKNAYQKIPDYAGQAMKLHERFVQAEHDLENNLRILLQEYREENLKVREQPAPKRFNLAISSSPLVVSSLAVDPVTYPKEMISEISAYRDNVYTLFEKAINEVKDFRKLLDAQYPFSVKREDHA